MKNTWNPSLSEVACLLKSGDEMAFEWLFVRYHQRIFNFAYGFLKVKEKSEEIVQDSFVILWQKRAFLRIEDNIESYLFTIARRLIIDVWRRESQSEKHRLYIKSILFSDASAETEELLDFNELKGAMTLAMEKLTVQQREVFWLSRFEDLSYEEISQKLNISKNTVKFHLTNALRVFKLHLKDYTNHYLVLMFFYFN